MDFGTSAARRIDYTDVTSDSIADVFEPYLVRGYKPKGSTNWEAAFQQVREANAAGPVADLVVLDTDGDPTARNHPPERVVAESSRERRRPCDARPSRPTWSRTRARTSSRWASARP